MRSAHPKSIIHNITLLGDSLSDCRAFSEREIMYGIIPNNWIVDLSKSPHGEFTNGYPWDLYLGAMQLNEFLSEDLEKKLNMTAEDIADAVEDDDPRIKPKVEAEATFARSSGMDSEGERYIRTYCEGGLTSHNYGSEWVLSFTLMAARKIVSTLEAKRNLLLEDDKKLGISAEEKKATLIIEWSGGNDLITVNHKPTNEEADKALAARMENIEKLYASGYRNFVLANLPDLAETPRFQALTEADRQNASAVCNHFNAKLAEQVLAMQKKYPDLSLHVFDAHDTFSKVYQNPVAYGLDESKKRQAYTTSKDYHMNPDRTSPAKGYMFWDDIHPTAFVHAITGNLMSKFIDSIYTLKPPAPTQKTDPKYMVKTFLREYHKTLRTERESIWSGYGRTTDPKLPHDTIESEKDYPRILADFLYHGLNEGGDRTLKILQNLNWVDKNKKIDISNPALLQAKEIYDRKTNSPKPHL